MKLFAFLFIALFLGSNIAMSQVSPGGVGTTNLTAWFRPDDLGLGDVTTWSSTYPVGAITLTDPSAPYPQLVNTPTGAISNYNKTLYFSGNSFIGLNSTTLQGLSNTSTLNLLDNAYSSGQGSFFHAYYLPQPTASNGHMMIYNESSDGIQLRNLGTICRLAIGKLSSNTLNASRDWADGYNPSIISYTGNRSNSTSMKGYYKGDLLPTPSVASQSTGNNGLYFGYSPNIATSAYNGFLHEYIFFNTDLTTQEVSRVHTYLAIKYGATLGTAGGGTNGDYLATNNSILWDADLNANYHNDVIGIGRDDIEELYQRQSHAFDDSCRIYLSSLAATNEANTGSFSNDISYLLMGHNNDPLCGTSASNTEMPAGITSRIAREFKVTKTNIAENFGWDVKIDTCSSIENLIDVSQVRLLVDTDGDFSNAQDFGTADGLIISVANGTVSIQNITEAMIPNNETRYITIAYIDVSYTIAGSGPICEGETGYVVFDLINATGSVFIEYTDGTTTQTISNVADGDTLFLNPTNTTIYTFTPFVGLINCCGSSNPITLQQVVNQRPTVTINPSATSLCFGEDLQLFGAGADSYVWDNGVTDGISFTPAVGSHTFEVIGTDLNGCSDTASVTVDIHALPTVSIQGEMTICIDTLLQLTANSSNTGTFSWAGNGSPFLSNTNSSNPTFTSNTVGNWELNVMFTDNNGCSASDTVWFNSIFCEIPNAIINASQLSICQGESIDFLDVSTGDSISIQNWTFQGGNPANGTGTGPHTIIYSTPGLYWVVLEEGNFVDSDFDSVQIEVLPCLLPDVSFSTNVNAICAGECFTAINTSQHGTTYEWYVNGQLVQTTTTENPGEFCFDVEGNVQLTLIGTNQYGTDTSSMQVIVYPLPQISVQSMYELIYGDSVTIEINHSPGNLLWSPSTDLCETCSVNTVSPEESTSYTITLTDQYGCVSESSISILINYENFVDVPDNFSPNGDGQNDILFVYGFGIENVVFRVFNRYGQQVFMSDDITIGWDGTVMGTLSNSGTFAYTVKYERIGGGVYYKEGFVNLIR